MKTREIALISIFTAIIVASNYTLIAFPQVKIMDGMIFLAGYLFGFPIAASITILSWLIYGSLNPLGGAGFPLIIILFHQLLVEIILMVQQHWVLFLIEWLQ